MTTWAAGSRILLAIPVTLIATHAMARAAQRIRQPPVVGEIIAGLLLGPTVLGALPGNPSKALFPSQVTGVLSTIAQIGVVLYLFIVGLDLDAARLVKNGRSVLTISLSSLVVPFALGALLSLSLYHSHGVVAGRAVNALAFTIFTGTAFAMTAFPVLARILTDSGLERHRLGRLAIGCAAVIDALGWLLLAVALAVANSKHARSPAVIIGEGAVLLLVLRFVVRPLLARLVARQRASERVPWRFLVLVVALTFASAAITDAIGLHPLFGAVLFGAAYPREANPGSAQALVRTLKPVTVNALLPFFFLLPGLQVNLRHIGMSGISELAMILLVAAGGKLVGTALATRASGYGWRDAAIVGALMNTRGLVELVVLSVGLTSHVFDKQLYGLMVVMALVTTMMTGPLLHVFWRSAWTASYDRPAVIRRGLLRSAPPAN